MTNLILALLGFVLVVIVVLDVLATTIRVGEGSLTRWIEQAVCELFSHLYKIFRVRLFLVWSGVLVIISMVLVWILLLWTGWVLVFTSVQDSLVNSTTGETAGFWAKVYFTGYTISTLGLGDYQPQTPLWQVFTALTSLSGLFLISLIITFLVPIAQAEEFRRQIALHIFHAGGTAQMLVLNTWNARSHTALASLLENLTPNLVQLHQRHLAFPVLHRFHGPRRSEAIELSIVALDEALSIIEYGLEDAQSEDFGVVRNAIGGYLDSLGAAAVKPSQKVVPIPSLEKLRTHGLPVVSDSVFYARLKTIEKRRRYLLSLVERSGWSWELVHAPK